MSTNMRDRLARAMIANLRDQGVFNRAPQPDEPLDPPVDEDFGPFDTARGFLVDGRLNAFGMIDAILSELREPDATMLQKALDVRVIQYEGLTGEKIGTITLDESVKMDVAARDFTAMIDTVREGK